MAKKRQPPPIEVVRKQAPLCTGLGTLPGKGMALVNEILEPESTDRAAGALFELLNLVEGIEDKRERFGVAFYCMFQCGLYFDEHLEVLRQVTAMLERRQKRRSPRKGEGKGGGVGVS